MMPVWFQWVVFVYLVLQFVMWVMMGYFMYKDENRISKSNWLCYSTIVSTLIIAALTLWFIAGGGK